MNPVGHAQSRLPFIITLVLEISVGLLLNGFIIFVIYRDFIKSKTVSSSYRILACLATFNVCFSILVSVGLLDYFCSLGIFTTIYATHIFIYLLLFIISSCVWITGSLSFFYFIKISNFKCNRFSWVKKNIGSLIPWMLLVELFLSLLNSALSSLFFIFFQMFPNNTTNISPSIISTLSQSSTIFVKSLIVDTVLPFIVVFITSLLTVVTLKKHNQRMKKVQTSDSEHRRSYEEVVSRMTQCFFFYVVFYIVMILFYFVVIIQIESGFWLLLLVLDSFIPVQATFLVLANPKLKATMKEMFLCVYLRDIAAV